MYTYFRLHNKCIFLVVSTCGHGGSLKFLTSDPQIKHFFFPLEGTTLKNPISVGRHMELHVALTFYLVYHFLLKTRQTIRLQVKEHEITYLVVKEREGGMKMFEYYCRAWKLLVETKSTPKLRSKPN